MAKRLRRDTIGIPSHGEMLRMQAESMAREAVMDAPDTKRLIDAKARELIGVAKKRVTSGGRPLGRKRR